MSSSSDDDPKREPNKGEIKKKTKEISKEEFGRLQPHISISHETKPLMQPWEITMVVIFSILALVLIVYLIYLFAIWFQANVGSEQQQKSPEHVIPRQQAWIDLGFGPTLGLTPKPTQTRASTKSTRATQTTQGTRATTKATRASRGTRATQRVQKRVSTQ